MKILYRHIATEVVQRALIILGVITMLMLLAKGLDYLEEMAQGEIPGQGVFALLGLALPKILALALPLAMFFGLLTTIGRLCLDSEMDAMAAAGVGLYNLLPLVVALGFVALLLEAGLTLGLEPMGEGRMARAKATFQQQALTSLVRSGQFNEFPGGRVLYFTERGSQGLMREVFFHDPKPRPPVTITAKRAELTQSENGKVEALFHQGRRYQGRPREGLARVMGFDRYRVRKSLGNIAGGDGGREAVATAELWQGAWADGSGVRRDRVELFRRLAIPLSVPVLLLLALPLGVERRRGGRSFGILGGALLVLAYHNALIAIEDWAGDGVVGAHWLLWATPVPVLGLAVFLLYRTVYGLPLMALPGAKRRRGAPSRRGP
ncbi:LPS export ABC transporter permease LptF [Thiohalorhabdus sp.]|uniref:LPS export ABC transporter permease LptF n=1 Tax=Thiohalorhabdus sp. TaxID=3094134 RepID=UPI002FC2951D